MFESHLAAFLFARRLLRGQNVGAKPLISGTLQYYSKTLHHQLSLQILSYPHLTYRGIYTSIHWRFFRCQFKFADLNIGDSRHIDCITSKLLYSLPEHLK